jgi:hypothetical protein
MNERNKKFFQNLIINVVFLMIGEGIGRLFDKRKNNFK